MSWTSPVPWPIILSYSALIDQTIHAAIDEEKLLSRCVHLETPFSEAKAYSLQNQEIPVIAAARGGLESSQILRQKDVAFKMYERNDGVRRRKPDRAIAWISKPYYVWSMYT